MQARPLPKVIGAKTVDATLADARRRWHDRCRPIECEERV